MVLSPPFPSSQTRNSSYYDQGRLTQLSNLDPVAGNLATYAYGYDLNYTTGLYTMLGQRVSMTATVPSEGLSNHLTTYEYDPLYQLVKTTYPNVAPFNGEVHSWTYDAIGNRLTNTVNSTTQTYTYLKIGANPLNWQRLLSDGVNSYTYGFPSSNPTGRNGPSGNVGFGWNVWDQLTGITGAVAASYLYDHQGRRASKTVSGATATYLYDGLNLIQEQGASPADYLFGPGIDEPLAMSRGGQAYYYATDALGSVAAVANSGGTVQNTYLYDAWGQVRTQTGSLANPFGYTSRELGEAELHFYRARYYQPSIGRFLQEDPLGFEAGDNNFYRYVLNTPLMSTDSSGKFTIDGSCDACSSAGPPPGAAPNWVSQLIQGVIRACRLIDSTITDPKLRACMHRTCDSGTIKCLRNCPKGVGGHTDFIFPGVINRTSGICVNNWPDVLPRLTDIVLHEFAHGCNWEHGGRKGVPGDQGPGFGLD